LKFLSHLDLMRTFQRIFRRARIPLAYSRGYNPHPKMAFSPALPVGATSDSEYLDAELSRELPEAEILARLGEQLPEGLEIKALVEVSQPTGSLNAIINRAGYTVHGGTTASVARVNQCLQELLLKDEILIKKQTKKGMKEKDIRPGIFTLKCREDREGPCIIMMLQAGSEGNVRPEFILDVLADECDIIITEPRVRRTGLYVYSQGQYRTPLAVVA